MKCPYCSQEHPYNINFCPVTGKAIIVQPVPSSSHPKGEVCPSCKREVKPGQRFCPACGKQLTIPEIAETKVAPVEVASSDIDEICPRCGKVLPQPGVRFCPACGIALIAENSVETDLTPKEDVPIEDVSSGVERITESRRAASALPSWLLYVGLMLIVAIAAGFIILRSGLFGNEVLASETVISQISPQETLTQASSGLAMLPSRTPSSSATSPSSPTAIATPTPNSTATAASTPTFTITSTLSPVITSTPIPTFINLLDSAALIYIPAGEFTMGSDPKSDPNFWGAEAPIHEVFISEYYIYILEVTNAQYAQCVAEQQCPRPEQIYSRTRREYYGNPRFDSYPVVYVTYQMAASYCIWAGGRLPSEAEWEKAARGTDGRLFPWGSELPNADLANYNETGVGDTMPVGSYPNGASAYGILDMGGNVLEWVYDLFDKAYYSYSQLDNPFGPAIGSRRVIRGGAWASGFDGLRTVGRASLHPEQSMENVGFRCVIETLP